MSAQSAIFNPSQTTSAASGDGFSVPRLTTTGRLAITFTAADKGMMVYDTTLNNLFIWTGAAWESVPASGDAGADGAVQFNDNGVVSGAANFYWSKVQQKVGIGTNSPNVELDVVGNSSITGDLTVKTNVLKVDTTNNRVGIRTASPAEPLTVDNTSGVTTGAIRIYATDQSHSRLAIQNINGQAYHLVAGNPGTSNAGFALYDNTAAATRWYVDNTGVQTWSNVGGAGTAMTLNSTGLGVGGSPLDKFTVVGNSFLRGAAAGVRIGDGGGYGFISAYDQTLSTAKDLVLQTGGGNVGIGVAPSAWRSTNKALQVGSYSSLTSSSAGDLQLFNNAYINSGGANIYQSNGFATRYEQYQGVHAWYTAPSGTAGNTATFTQAMTLDASGFLRLAASNASSAGSYWLQVKNTGASSNAVWLENLSGNDRGIIVFKHDQATGATTGTMTVFQNGGGSTVGSITSTNTGTAYNIASDYRLKESVQTLTNGLARINSLKPSTYKWKADGSSGEGFLAHELASIVPLAVTGEKDAVNEDGSIKPQQVDLSKVVPILVAAIQELTARVQTLETR